jgi:dTDP-glucose 4,6-dehydratase
MGFIGSNFVRHLLAVHPAARVVNLDKLTYAGNPRNLADLLVDSRHVFVHGDICDEALVGETLRAHGVETVVHFAAESHVDRSIQQADDFIRTNVQGTRVLLDAARRHAVRRFLHISTDEVYGSLGGSGTFSEESPLLPNSPYAASKAGADALARAYFVTYGLPVIITRTCNNYGPYQFPEKLIPLMIANALRDQPLPVYGDGKNVRDWIHVEDHCVGLAAALERGRPGEVYNLGGSNERQNLDIVHRILDLLGKPRSLVKFVGDRPGHDRRYAIDAAKARRELGWEPRRRFEDGLAGTVAWYRENRGWWERILSGEYRGWYERQYGNRS